MKKYLKKILIISAILILLANMLIIVHAYHFTHFANEGQKPNVGVPMPLGEKLVGLFTGFDIPRPRGTKLPQGKYETIEIKTADSQILEGWHLYTSAPKEGIVLLFHGYVDNKSSMIERAEEFLALGYDAILIDFMGSGNSYGNQTTMGYREGENVYQTYLYAHNIAEQKNIYLLGFSMGAAAITKAQASHQMNVSGIILEASYANYEGTIAARVDMMGMPRQPLSKIFAFWAGKINGFDGLKANPIDFAKKIHVPTLVMCGSKDANIPPEETTAIYNAVASTNKNILLLDKSAHESYLNNNKEEWQQAIIQFLEKTKK